MGYNSGGMEVILTHDNADFDAVASLLGAAKLFPEAVPVLPRRVNRNCRAFLSLYGAVLPFVEPDDLPRRRRITRAILVDTQGLTTLKGMKRNLAVDIIDHHALDRTLPPTWTFSGETLGATTTLLTEEISARAIELTSVEATLLLLGIYEDTGSLSYPSTTSRDVRAAAWLLDQGANLSVANEFLHHPLAPQQWELYERLLEGHESHEVAGHTVIIAAAETEGYSEEISTLAHKLRDLLEPAALFVLVGLNGARRVQLVARSDTEAIDVSQVAVHFGGGGHPQAAAALIRNRSLESVRRELLALLPKVVRPGVTVAQLMSRGVQVLAPETTVAEAAERMRRTGHEGYPVVADGRVIGLLTRRAVDRALQFEMADVPVTQVMEAGSVTVGVDDSVEHLQRLMIESGWGQIPVVAEGRIVGVVTRTDLITLWGTPETPPRRHEVAALLERSLPAPTLALVRRISQAANEMGYVPYFVGGLVRDLLLGQSIVDVDIVIEGDGVALARRLAAEMGGRVRTHRRFGTAKWLLEPEVWERVFPQEGRPRTGQPAEGQPAGGQP
ncbi:MAG TPA: CBS domain-containing protein, partial [Anaerolineae bacterium]|nr:CBS domain-containing protein [Anaerolineae bacterium]